MKILNDIKAYMEEAALQIAKEQGFKPESEEHMADWLVANRVAICTRASRLMWSILAKLKKHKVEETVKSIMSVKVWRKVRVDDINHQVACAIKKSLC